MEVEAELGGAFTFSSYDGTTNTYEVFGEMIGLDDVGRYPIIIRSQFFNETHVETFEDIFYLTVWADTESSVDSWFPPDPIEFPKWEGSIRENTELGEFHPDQPVPYIADLTQTGVMTIGWDRQMTPPGNYTEIPIAQVAVRSWDDIIAELDSDRRREL